MDAPVPDLGVNGAEAEQLVFDEEGTTLVRPTASSSPSVNPVTFLPSTNGLPAGVLTWRKTPGAWQTSATGFPAARKASISFAVAKEDGADQIISIKDKSFGRCCQGAQRGRGAE